MNNTFQPNNQNQGTEKIRCHFKQTEGDECFAYHFVNKSECATCWKRYRFIEEYAPAKKEYDERVKRSQENRSDKIHRFVSWGNGIVTKSELTKV